MKRHVLRTAMQVLQETADAWEGGNENVPHIMYEADEEKVYDCK